MHEPPKQGKKKMTITNRWIIVFLITTILGVLIIITEKEKTATREKAATKKENTTDKNNRNTANDTTAILEKLETAVAAAKKLGRKEQELRYTKDRIVKDAKKERHRQLIICAEYAFNADADGATNDQIINYVNSKKNDPRHPIFDSCFDPADKIFVDMLESAYEPINKLFDKENPLTKKYLATSDALEEISPDTHEQYLECIRMYPGGRIIEKGFIDCIADIRSSIQSR